MHYANGRPAKNGDCAIQFVYGKPIVGILYDAKPGNDYCNGMLAPLGGGAHTGACLADCLRFDDLLTAAGINVALDIRGELAKIPQRAE